MQVPKNIDDDNDDNDDDNDDEGWVKTPLKHGFVKAGAPPPFLRNDSGPAAHLTPAAPTHARSVPPEMLTSRKSDADNAGGASAAPKSEMKSDRRPIRYAFKGGAGSGGGGGGGGGGATTTPQAEGRRSASREGSVQKRVKVPKKRETETIYIIPETLPEEVLAKERIRRDTDFLMQGLVF